MPCSVPHFGVGDTLPRDCSDDREAHRTRPRDFRAERSRARAGSSGRCRRQGLVRKHEPHERHRVGGHSSVAARNKARSASIERTNKQGEARRVPDAALRRAFHVGVGGPMWERARLISGRRARSAGHCMSCYPSPCELSQRTGPPCARCGSCGSSTFELRQAFD